MTRTAFMISDGTGLTVESLGNSLLSQFDKIKLEKHTIPYVDSAEKALEVVERIDQSYAETKTKSLVFLTIVNPEISTIIKKANARFFDLFSTFLSPIEEELGCKSSFRVGKTHGLADLQTYNNRIEAINYTLAHDDGIKLSGYDRADLILIGVSRSGKTPSCLYMALQFGVFAANYPLTDDDLSYSKLPECLKEYKDKLFGLTIAPERLQQIRTERRPNSKYSSKNQCIHEVNEVERLFRDEKIPFLNSTHYSIEEIVTRVMAATKIKRKF